MNLFRLCGDVSHVVSIVVLALRLNATKSAVGISLKTQELYLIVFVARYADLFSHFYSLYNRRARRRSIHSSFAAQVCNLVTGACFVVGVASDAARVSQPNNNNKYSRSVPSAAHGKAPAPRYASLSNTADPYLQKIRAVGFPAYEKAHRKALATKFAAKAFPRLPTEVAAQVVAFAFHVGYY